MVCDDAVAAYYDYCYYRIDRVQLRWIPAGDKLESSIFNFHSLVIHVNGTEFGIRNCSFNFNLSRLSIDEDCARETIPAKVLNLIMRYMSFHCHIRNSATRPPLSVSVNLLLAPSVSVAVEKTAPVSPLVDTHQLSSKRIVFRVVVV